MTHTTVSRAGHPASYRALLGVPHVRRMLTGWTLGRLPGGLIALGFALSTLQAGGTLALCGEVTAAFALGYGTAAPVLGRLIDRRGPVAVLRTVAALHSLGLLAAAVLAGHGHPHLLLPVAAVSGATVPPLVACQRAMWPRLLDSDLQGRAAAFEAMAVNAVYLAGPLVAGLLSLAHRAEVALAVASVLSLVGVLVFTSVAPVRAVRPEPADPLRRDWLGPLRHPAVPSLLAAGVGFSAAVSALDLSALAWGRSLGLPAAGGWLIAGFTGVGIASAAWYGRRPVETEAESGEGFTETRGWLLVLAAGAGLGALSCTTGLPWLLPAVLLATQVAVSPLMVTLVVLAGHRVDPALRTELHTWRTSANQLGWALGAVVAGAVTSGGTSSPLPAVGSAAALALVAAGLTLVGARAEQRTSRQELVPPAVRPGASALERKEVTPS